MGGGGKWENPILQQQQQQIRACVRQQSCVRDAAGPSVGAPVEAVQHGGVGPLEQPALAGGGGVARVHEDPPLAGAAVDAAVADGVIQALVLEARQ